MSSLLELVDCSFVREQSIIVEHVSLELSTGEIACIVGRSGTGKTTLVHGLAGFEAPATGKILYNGNDASGSFDLFSYMFQDATLLPERRVIDNVILPLILRGRMSKEEAYQRVEPLFERFGIAGLERKWPQQLSGGQRQRAAFLRATLLERPIMLLDEPFSALDALTRSDLRQWLIAMIHDLGLSALMITHDIDEALIVGDKVYVLAGEPRAGKPGTIVGSVVPNKPDTAEQQAFELTPQFLDAKRQIIKLLHV